MCRCFFSNCPGVNIPGRSPLGCRDQVYVFIRDPCKNPASVDCIPTWSPDPRGDHDQCSSCVRTQRGIFPGGVRTSPSKRKVHTPRHAAPNYAPPLYVQSPRYEDSRPSTVPESATATELELPPTPSRFNLPVVPPMPTRRPGPSGIVGQTMQIPAANTAKQQAEPCLAPAGFTTPSPETSSGRVGLRIPTATAAARSAGTRSAALGFLTPRPENNSRQTGLRIPTGNAAIRLAEPGPFQGTSLGRTGLRTPTAYDRVRPPTPIPSRNLNSSASSLQTPAASYIPRPRTLPARPGSTEPLVSTVATVEAPTGQQSRLTSLPLPRVRPVIYIGGTDTRTHLPTVNSQLAPRLPTQDRSARLGSNERMASRTGAVEALIGQQGWLTSPPMPTVLPVIQAGETDLFIDPSSVNSQLAPENFPTHPPRSDTPRPACAFLAPPPRHDTRSPPPGINLAEWDVDEVAPQLNSNSPDWDLLGTTHVAHGNRGNDIIARPGLANSNVGDQLYIAQTVRRSTNDAGPPMENQHFSRWESIQEWACRIGGITRTRDNVQEHEQKLRYTSRQGDSSRSGGQANRQDPKRRRYSLAESLRTLRRRPFPSRRQNSQPELDLNQAQARLEPPPNAAHTYLAPNNNPTAATVGAQLPNLGTIAAAAAGRPSIPTSDRDVSEVLHRTCCEVSDSSQQRSHSSYESESITTPSILSTGSECSQGHRYDSENHLSQSGGSNCSSSSSHASIEGLDGGEELLEIGRAIVRVDAGAQATDWDWNF